ncbi:MAG: hypothetical protein ACOX1P_21580 [Thermoguttaceae bacterium]
MNTSAGSASASKRWASIPRGADRAKTAGATLELVELAKSSDEAAVVEVLARARIATSQSAMGECLGKAAELGGTLEGTNWEIFETAGRLADQRREAANSIRAAVAEALASDEHVTPLAPALKSRPIPSPPAFDKSDPPGSTRPPAPAPSAAAAPPAFPPPPIPPRSTTTIIDQGSTQAQDAAEAIRQLNQLQEKLSANQRLRVSLRWQIEEEEK